MRDNDATVREAAVRAVAALRDAGSEPTVAEMLRRDASEPVRVAAVQALTLLQARREGRTALVAALKDSSPLVRREAANALGGASADIAAELIAAYRAERDPTVQQALIYALARVPHNLTVVSQIEVLLRTAARSESVPVREAAIFSLGSFSSPEAKAIVLTGLSDKSERVQVAAIQSAARQRNTDAVPQLVGFLEDKPPDIRSAAVESLGRIGDPRAVQPLVGRLKDEDEYVRTSAQRWLSTLQADEALEQALQDPSAPVRLRAISAIDASTGAAPVPALIRALGDEDYEVRAAAIRVLSKVADEDDVALITGAVRDPKLLMKESALEVLSNLAARQPRPNLNDAEAVVEDLLRRPPNPVVLAEAIRTAGWLGGPRWLEFILTASLSDDAAVRRAAAESLAGYGTSDSIEALQRLAKDPVLDVQAAAINSLRRLNVK
jgi:HEAT repeat protein